MVGEELGIDEKVPPVDRDKEPSPLGSSIEPLRGDASGVGSEPLGSLGAINCTEYASTFEPLLSSSEETGEGNPKRMPVVSFA